MTQQIIHNLHIVSWTMVAQEVITNFPEWFKGKLLFSLSCVMKVSSSTIFRIWGAMKTPPLNLVWLREGNFSARDTNAEDSLSKAFTNYLNKPSLICTGGKKILSLFTSGLCMMLCFPCSISSRIGQSLRT